MHRNVRKDATDCSDMHFWPFYITYYTISIEQESLANTKVNARQQCVYKGPNLQQINARKVGLHSVDYTISLTIWVSSFV